MAGCGGILEPVKHSLSAEDSSSHMSQPELWGQAGTCSAGLLPAHRRAGDHGRLPRRRSHAPARSRLPGGATSPRLMGITPWQSRSSKFGMTRVLLCLDFLLRLHPVVVLHAAHPGKDSQCAGSKRGGEEGQRGG